MSTERFEVILTMTNREGTATTLLWHATLASKYKAWSALQKLLGEPVAEANFERTFLDSIVPSLGERGDFVVLEKS